MTLNFILIYFIRFRCVHYIAFNSIQFFIIFDSFI